jgi:hypothetical protein
MHNLTFFRPDAPFQIVTGNMRREDPVDSSFTAVFLVAGDHDRRIKSSGRAHHNSFSFYDVSMHISHTKYQIAPRQEICFCLERIVGLRWLVIRHTVAAGF